MAWYGLRVGPAPLGVCVCTGVYGLRIDPDASKPSLTPFPCAAMPHLHLRGRSSSASRSRSRSRSTRSPHHSSSSSSHASPPDHWDREEDPRHYGRDTRYHEVAAARVSARLCIAPVHTSPPPPPPCPTKTNALSATASGADRIVLVPDFIGYRVELVRSVPTV